MERLGAGCLPNLTRRLAILLVELREASCLTLPGSIANPMGCKFSQVRVGAECLPTFNPENGQSSGRNYISFILGAAKDNCSPNRV